jgi:N-ethylmaleimide reductase
LAVMDQLIEVFGSGRVGIKLSPLVTYNDMFDTDVVGIYTYLLGELNKRNVAFIEINEGTDLGTGATPFTDANPQKPFEGKLRDTLKPLFNGAYMANFRYTFESANEALSEGSADLVSFGYLFVTNADLVTKFKTGQRLNEIKYVEDKSKVGLYLYHNPKGTLGYTDLSVYEPRDAPEEVREQL